jgi:hypothetical protein
MQITSPKHTVAALAVAAAFCAPVAAQAKGGHGHAGEHGPAPTFVQNTATTDGTETTVTPRAPRGPRMTNVIVKGKVASVDGSVVTVTVSRANHHGRALRGQDVQLDVTNARIRVKDVNGDGVRDAADVAAGDRVLAQVRVPRRAPLDLTQAFSARRLIDVGPAPAPKPKPEPESSDD